jgi:hypothetical protein
LNLSGQLQEVHDLGDPRPRDAFPGRDSGLGKPGIVVELLAPRLCQQERMHPRFLALWQLLGRGGEVLQDAGRERERLNNKWPGTPSGTRDAEG